MVDVPAEPILPGDQTLLAHSQSCLTVKREIRITVLQVPVTYESVLAIVPGLHAKPPVLPSDSLSLSALPLEGYDIFFHVGVTGRGPLRMERIAHKFGYNMKDATGTLAPVVRVSREENGQPSNTQRPETFPPRAMRDPNAESPVDGNDTPRRGFGKGYESYPDEVCTDIDTEKLVNHLKKCGIEVSDPAAGLYAVNIPPTLAYTIANIHVHGCRALPM